MRTSFEKNCFFSITLLLIVVAPALTASGAIMTNWVAFNDHRPGPTPPPAGQWGTALKVTPYDMRVGPGGNLTNFLNGQQLAATLSVTANGTPDDFGTCFEPNDNTPAAKLFKGIVDVANPNSVIGVRFSTDTYTVLRFSGLDPFKHYVFRGTSVRGGSYPLRWTVATIMANGW